MHPVIPAVIIGAAAYAAIDKYLEGRHGRSDQPAKTVPSEGEDANAAAVDPTGDQRSQHGDWRADRVEDTAAGSAGPNDESVTDSEETRDE